MMESGGCLEEKMMKDNQYQIKANLLYRWIRFGQNGITVSKLLLNRGYHSIAIYGYNEIARCFMYEAEKGEFTIRYLIDRKGDTLPVSFSVLSVDEFNGDDVDALLVMLVDSEDVCDELRMRFKCDVISVEELFYEL